MATHTWFVRTARGSVWHTVSLPIGNEERERQRGEPDGRRGKSGCGLTLPGDSHWSWGGHYYGGAPLPVCGRCRKAGCR